MMMAAQVVVRTGDAAAVVVEVLVAACCPAVEWREKNRSGSWRRPAIPETAETCAPLDTITAPASARIGSSHAWSGSWVGTGRQVRTRQLLDRRACRSFDSRAQPTVSTALLPSPQQRCQRCWGWEAGAGTRRRCALPSGGARAAPRELGS